MQEEPIKKHPFEYTLGAGPYRFRGSLTIIKPSEANPMGNLHTLHSQLPARFISGMGTCAHCCQGIMNVFFVEIGNGDVYGVGCDCIEKVGLPISEMKKVKKVVSERTKQLAQLRKVKKVESSEVELADLIKTKSVELSGIVHPFIPEKTLLDYAVYCSQYNANVLNALTRIKNLLKNAQVSS